MAAQQVGPVRVAPAGHREIAPLQRHQWRRRQIVSRAQATPAPLALAAQRQEFTLDGQGSQDIVARHRCRQPGAQEIAGAFAHGRLLAGARRGAESQGRRGADGAENPRAVIGRSADIARPASSGAATSTAVATAVAVIAVGRSAAIAAIGSVSTPAAVTLGRAGIRGRVLPRAVLAAGWGAGL